MSVVRGYAWGGRVIFFGWPCRLRFPPQLPMTHTARPADFFPSPRYDPRGKSASPGDPVSQDTLPSLFPIASLSKHYYRHCDIANFMGCNSGRRSSFWANSFTSKYKSPNLVDRKTVMHECACECACACAQVRAWVSASKGCRRAAGAGGSTLRT